MFQLMGYARMQRNNQAKVFRRRYKALNVLGLLLFVGMIIQSIVTGTVPSLRWQLPFGCLFMAIGIHLIMYKNEASELLQEQYDSFWKGFPRASFYYDPILIAGIGVVCCLISAVFLIKGILG